MAVQTAAGTTIGISADKPATFTAAGYEALTFTIIGEIVDAGGAGATYAPITHSPLGSRAVQKYKGSVDYGSRTLQLALDNEDAGQILAKQALHSDEDFYFEVAYQNGDKDYFPAKVMNLTKSVSSVDTIVSATIELAITATKEGVGIIEVLAAPAP